MGERHETFGTATLYIGEKAVGNMSIRTQMRFSLCGEGLCIGYDGGDAVSSLYQPRFAFTDGTIHKVIFDIAKDKYVGVEKLLAAAMARE
jgi:arylsulfatase